MDLYNPNKHDKKEYDLYVEIDRETLFDDAYIYYLHLKEYKPIAKLNEVKDADRAYTSKYLLFESYGIPKGLIQPGQFEKFIVFDKYTNKRDILKIKKEIIKYAEIQTTGWRDNQTSLSNKGKRDSKYFWKECSI